MRKKTVLVTGGSKGIGKSIALKFAKRGYDVVITYNSSEKEARNVASTLKSYGADARVIKANFLNINEIENVFIQFDKYYDSLDVLVNNAGWTKYISHSNLDDLTEELFDKIIDINLKSVFFCIENAVKRMKGQDCCIVNISSIAGYNGIGSNIAYCAAKAGVICMTKSLARAFGPKIRVIAIAPGLTETEMTKLAPKAYREEQIRITPLNRIARPEDIANAAISLVEEMKFVNGQTIVLDGGRLS